MSCWMVSLVGRRVRRPGVSVVLKDNTKKNRQVGIALVFSCPTSFTGHTLWQQRHAYLKWYVSGSQHVKKILKLVVFWYWTAVYWSGIGFVGGCKEGSAGRCGG